MEFKRLLTGAEIPVLGLGTWGRPPAPPVATIRAAIDLGMTHIDTAESYGDGQAEELVGEAIQGHPREGLFITTKVRPQNLRYDAVIAACGRSLRRLRTSYIDLYLVHAPNPEIPIEETMRAMDRLVEDGLVRSIGVSNFSVEQMKEAQQHAENKIVANEIEYNLLVRDTGSGPSPNRMVDMESRIIPYCQRNGVVVIAFRPVANGELSKPGIRILDELAERYRKTQAQIALNWLISKPNVATIPKTTKVEHVRENLGAVGWRLSEADMRTLDKDFPKRG